MRRDMRLKNTPFTYILIFYPEGKEGPADFLQKQEMWPGGNSFPPVSVVCAPCSKARAALERNKHKS